MNDSETKLSREQADETDDSVPFFPTHFMSEARMTAVLIALLVVVGAIGLIRPPELGPPANPLDTPLHIKPEWYFLALYQALKYVPEFVGTLLPIVLVGLLVLWPFLDRRPDQSRRSYRWRALVMALILAAAVILSYKAWVS